jgi:hypothetical protein
MIDFIYEIEYTDQVEMKYWRKLKRLAIITAQRERVTY